MNRSFFLSFQRYIKRYLKAGFSLPDKSQSFCNLEKARKMSVVEDDDKTAPAVNAASSEAVVSPNLNRRRRTNPLVACCQKIPLPEFLRDPFERQYFFLVVITSPLWRFLMCLCILLMLFGSPVQHLWCDPKYDAAFDVLHTIAFCVFCLDIILRILVVPGYISFKYKSLMHQFNWKKRRYSRVDEDLEKWGKIDIGSFLFWCDVISTACLLYEISYVNKSQNKIHTVDIRLDAFGIPVSYIEQSIFCQLGR